MDVFKYLNFPKMYLYRVMLRGWQHVRNQSSYSAQRLALKG